MLSIRSKFLCAAVIAENSWADISTNGPGSRVHSLMPYFTSLTFLRDYFQSVILRERTGWWTDGFPFPVFCILILWRASTPFIQGGSRMRESRTYGFVRGVPGDQHPYRD